VGFTQLITNNKTGESKEGKFVMENKKQKSYCPMKDDSYFTACNFFEVIYDFCKIAFNASRAGKSFTFIIDCLLGFPEFLSALSGYML